MGQLQSPVVLRMRFVLQGWSSKQSRQCDLNMGTATVNLVIQEQDLGLTLIKSHTRMAVFLAEINLVVPWSELLSLIPPHVPRAKTVRCSSWRRCCASTSSRNCSDCPTWPWNKFTCRAATQRWRATGCSRNSCSPEQIGML